MGDRPGSVGRLPDVYMTPGTSSFTDFLTVAAPELLPGARGLLPGPVPEVPHGTTIVSAVYRDGPGFQVIQTKRTSGEPVERSLVL